VKRQLERDLLEAPAIRLVQDRGSHDLVSAEPFASCIGTFAANEIGVRQPGDVRILVEDPAHLSQLSDVRMLSQRWHQRQLTTYALTHSGPDPFVGLHHEEPVTPNFYFRNAARDRKNSGTVRPKSDRVSDG
jgi:hypothetical protein